MRRRHLLTLVPLAALATACTTDPTPTPTPPTAATPFPTPSSGDWQTGPPETGTPTRGPIEPSITAEPPASTLPPGKTGVPRGQNTPDDKVKRTKADSVATAFAERLVTLDTKLDNRPNDAARRAAAFATDTLAEQLRKGAPTGGVGNEFRILQQHKGWTLVQSTLGGLGEPPPDTATTAVRAVTTTTTGTNATGWEGKPATTTWLLELTRTSKKANWAVSAFQAIS